MDDHPLDELLEKLSIGDLSAVERVFLAYEPYLRKVVRRHLPVRLRSKFDSLDVVQSVWVDVLRGFRDSGRRFASPAHLRHFLVLVARHRLDDRVRHHRVALERELPMPTDISAGPSNAGSPRPSQLAQADELWAKMLALAPPGHHEVLRLKREGQKVLEIADRTGLHPDSIRRILRKLARQIALAEGRSSTSAAEPS